MKQYILFDLDGTLTDPKVGITTCVQYALQSFGIDEPDLDKLEPFIGPPLKDSFMEYYDLSEEDAEKAVAKYRERFQDIGIFENELYGGINDLLRTLKNGGMHLAVASSKPQVFVERILKHFKLDKYFEVVVGSELDGTRVEKPQVIQEVLHRFFPEHQPRYDEVYMVGDRKFDIQGARTFRIESVGVTYGYGTMEELKEAKADYIVSSVAELKNFLMREVNEKKQAQARNNPAGQNGRQEKPKSAKLLWQLVLSIATFYVVKIAVTTVLTTLVQMLAMQMPVLEPVLFLRDDAGQIVAFNANASVILHALGFIGGAFGVKKTATLAITRTAEITRLSHLKKEPPKTYVLFGLATIGAVVGVSQLLELTGMSALTEAAQTGVEVQELPALWLGLIVYGIVIPAAEEVLFRGIGYNCIRRFVKMNFAIVLTALVFSSFSGDPDKTLYIFAIGLICTYAYEYFGSFYAPVAIRIAAGIISYLLDNTVLGDSAFVSTPVCAVFLIGMAAGLFFLEREKNLFKNQTILSSNS